MLLDAAERLQRRKALISPRRGFYVIVPPQFLAWGAPPPSWYIDDLMRHEGRPYYVGLLKAAELHGASHQAAMEFQVISDKRLPKIRAGRSAIAFYYRKDITAITAAIEERRVDTGRMKLPSLELTMFDLLRYPHASGGLSNVATVFSELAGRVDPSKLAALAPAFERSVAQRVGTCSADSVIEKARAFFMKRSCGSGPLFPGLSLNLHKPAIQISSRCPPHAMSAGTSLFDSRRRSTNDSHD